MFFPIPIPIVPNFWFGMYVPYILEWKIEYMEKFEKNTFSSLLQSHTRLKKL